MVTSEDGPMCQYCARQLQDDGEDLKIADQTSTAGATKTTYEITCELCGATFASDFPTGLYGNSQCITCNLRRLDAARIRKARKRKDKTPGEVAGEILSGRHPVEERED